ncbi:MAG: hypothetical protein WKG07_41780 [Hymenobacter sp.]
MPYLDEKQRTSLADFKAVAARLSAGRGRCARPLAWRVGYHNHEFEFKPIDGTTLYDVLLRETDPRAG